MTLLFRAPCQGYSEYCNGIFSTGHHWYDEDGESRPFSLRLMSKLLPFGEVELTEQTLTENPGSPEWDLSDGLASHPL